MAKSWPPKDNGDNSRSPYPSQGPVGSHRNSGLFGILVRLNATGLVKNPEFKSGDKVTATHTAFKTHEIWTEESFQYKPLNSPNRGNYHYYSPYRQFWTTTDGEYAVVANNPGPSPHMVPPPLEVVNVDVTGGSVGSGLGPTPTTVNPFVVGAAYYNPVPTLNSPGSFSYGVTTGTYGAIVTNIDAFGVTVTAALGKTPAETIQNIKNALRAALLKKGHTQADVDAFLASYVYKAPTGNPSNSNPPGTGPRGGPGGGSSKTVSYGIVSKPIVSQLVTVRLGRSYETPRLLPPLSTGAEDTKPQMIQYLANQPVRSAEDLNNGIPESSTTETSSNFSSLKFVFPYIPSDVQYSSLSSVWTEIPRGYNYPFLDWSSFQRMKVSFSLIVASTRLEPGGVLVPDGMDASVDEQLNVLRLMFQTKQPITIYNMDSLLTNTNDSLSKKPTQFVMTDLTIEAIRRQKTPPQRITTAQVNITLLEIIVESSTIFNIKRPSFDEIVPNIPTNTTTPSGPDLWSPTLQVAVGNTIVLPTGTP